MYKFFFWKNVLQYLLRSVPLVPNSKNITNGAVLAKRKLLCKIKLFFWGKFSLRICSQNWYCFLNIFSRTKLSKQAKTFIFFFLNVLQGVLKRVPLVPNSKKLTNGAVLAKTKLLCKIKFFFEENFLWGFVPKIGAVFWIFFHEPNFQIQNGTFETG